MLPRKRIGAEHCGHLRNERQRQRRGDPESFDFGPIQRELALLFLFARTIIEQSPGEARFRDRFEQLLRCDPARLAAHPRAFRSQVDGRLDTLDAVQHLLQSHRAGRTGHALDTQFERLQRHPEPGFLDGRHHLLRSRSGRPHVDARPLGSQIDAGRDTGQAVKHLLDACRAGGAGHAADRQIQLEG